MQTMLHQAIREENLKQAELLIGQGVDINAQDDNGNTPLHIATTRLGKAVMINILKLPLDEKFDREAIYNKRSECVMLLLNNMADIYVENNDGDSFALWLSRNDMFNTDEFVNILNTRKNLMESKTPVLFAGALQNPVEEYQHDFSKDEDNKTDGGCRIS